MNEDKLKKQKIASYTQIDGNWRKLHISFLSVLVPLSTLFYAHHNHLPYRYSESSKAYFEGLLKVLAISFLSLRIN